MKIIQGLQMYSIYTLDHRSSSFMGELPWFSGYVIILTIVFLLTILMSSTVLWKNYNYPYKYCPSLPTVFLAFWFQFFISWFIICTKTPEIMLICSHKDMQCNSKCLTWDFWLNNNSNLHARKNYLLIQLHV